MSDASAIFSLDEAEEAGALLSVEDARAIRPPDFPRTLEITSETRSRFDLDESDEILEGAPAPSVRRGPEESLRESLGVGGVSSLDLFPPAAIPLAIDDVMDIRRRMGAGLDVGPLEEYATYIAAPLATVPFIAKPLKALDKAGRWIGDLFGITKRESVFDDITDEELGHVAEEAMRLSGVPPESAIPNRPIGGIVEDLDPVAGAKGKIGLPEFHEVARDETLSYMDKAVSRVLDALHPIQVAAKQGAEIAGEIPDFNPYREMRNVAGVRGVVEAVLEHGTISRTDGGVEFSGKGLKEVFRPVRGDMDNAMLYFAGMRAKELSGRGVKTPFTPEEMEAMVGLGDTNPAIRETFQEYQAYNRRLLDFAEQSGVLSKQQKKVFIEMGQSYVPFYRVVLDRAGEATPSGGLFKRLKGGETNLQEIEQNIVRNTVLMVDASVKNHAKKTVYDMIDSLPGMERYAVKMPAPPPAAILKESITRLKEMGLPSDVAESTARVLSYDTIPGKNIDTVYRNGKPEYYEIRDPDFMKAMSAYSPKVYDMATRILMGIGTAPKRVLTSAITKTPEFMVVNGLRDMQAAWLQTRTGAFPVIDAIRGFTTRLGAGAGIKGDAYWELLANGGGFSTTYKGEAKMGRELTDLYLSHGIDTRRVLHTPARILAAWEEIASSFEMANRIAEFEAGKRLSIPLSEAAFESREVSSDFAKRGSSEFVHLFTATTPFLNARMQGLARLAREAKDNPAKLAVKGLVTITLPSLVLWYHNRKDPRVQAQPDWVRDNHWLIAPENPDEPLYMISKGFEHGAMFATIPERIADAYLTGENKELFEHVFRIMGEQLSLIQYPQILKIPIEQSMNRKLFFDTPIVSKSLEGVKPSEQFTAFTSDTFVELARVVSEQTGVEMSPVRAEHLVRGFFGTLGGYMLEASDAMMRSVADLPPPAEKRTDEKPVVRRFIRQQPFRNTQHEVDFYNMLSEIRMADATVSKVLREARAPASDDITMSELRASFDRIQRISASLERQMRLIDAEMPPPGGDVKKFRAAKRLRIESLQAKKNQMFEVFVGSLSAVKEKIEAQP